MLTEKPKYNPKMPIIAEMIHVLYSLDGCGCGGLCHIVTDDDNIRDSDLEWVIQYCKKKENKDRVDKELSSWICELLLQLTIEQRAGLFTLMNDYDFDIDEVSWDILLRLDDVQELIDMQCEE